MFISHQTHEGILISVKSLIETSRYMLRYEAKNILATIGIADESAKILLYLSLDNRKINYEIRKIVDLLQEIQVDLA